MRKIPRGYFFYGRDFMRGRDRELAFGFWRRKDPEEGEIAFHISFSLSWDWPRMSWTFIRD